MPMTWRFEHEDDSDARTVISLNGAKAWDELRGRQCEYAVADAIEGWAEEEQGGWSDGDLVKVVVLRPKNMAGTYQVSLAVSCSAVAYRATEEVESSP